MVVSLSHVVLTKGRDLYEELNRTTVTIVIGELVVPSFESTG